MKEEDSIWGGLLRLYDRVKALSENMKWPELLEMVDGQVFKDFDQSAEADKFFSHEQFLMRLCLRYENFKKADFNIVSMDDKNERFRIGNYDFNTFLWAKKVSPDFIDNNFVYVPYDKLSNKQLEAFKEKAVNNYDKGE